MSSDDDVSKGNRSAYYVAKQIALRQIPQLQVVKIKFAAQRKLPVSIEVAQLQDAQSLASLQDSWNKAGCYQDPIVWVHPDGR